VRENQRKNRTLPLADQINRSINQTLSRTILTSGTTLLASGSLLLLGGEVIRGFAFVMTVGIIVGTYSSIFIASPFALLWEQYRGRKEKAAEKAPAAPAKVTPAAPKSAPAPNGGRPAPAGKRRRGRG
jgi:preprotein translocase subunit SecF